MQSYMPFYQANDLAFRVFMQEATPVEQYSYYGSLCTSESEFRNCVKSKSESAAT